MSTSSVQYKVTKLCEKSEKGGSVTYKIRDPTWYFEEIIKKSKSHNYPNNHQTSQHVTKFSVFPVAGLEL